MRRDLRYAGLALVMCATVGCIGIGSRADPPPKPTRSLVAAIVGLAADVRSGDCRSLVITLDSGELVTMSFAEATDACDNEVTPIVLGQPEKMSTRDGVEPLVLAGTLDGATWIGTAQWDEARKGWCVIFNAGEGAYREGAGFHLASGLVVPLAADFHWLSIDRSDLLPLRRDDDFCLNERGEVRGINVWTSY